MRFRLANLAFARVVAKVEARWAANVAGSKTDDNMFNGSFLAMAAIDASAG